VKKCQPRALTPFLDRELSDDLQQEISEHLQSCPTCGTLLDELSLASEQVRSMGRAEIPRSALQPALEVLTHRAGLVREGSITHSQTRDALGPPPEAPVADGEPATPTSKAPEVPAESSVLPSEASSSEPDAPFTATAMYEWSDPDKMHATEAPAISAEAEMGTSLVEQDLPVSTDLHGALPEHPSPPPTEIRPPWMEAASGEDEDLEEVGRRAVDEAIEAGETTASEDALEPHEGDSAGHEIAGAEAEPAGIDAAPVEAPPRTSPEGYWSRPAPTPARSGGGLGSLGTQLRIGLLSALVLIVLAAAVLYTGRSARQVSTGSTHSSPTRQATRSPAASPSQATTPYAAPSAPGAPAPAGELTEVVTAGSGGSGWRVLRVRSGSPGAGITRIVFDLDGAGPAPDARMGRGSDGAIYLSVSGISISPAEVSGFAGAGPITGITQTGPSGLALRFATSGKPGFSISYLGAPSRLVLDFK
jgi:Putative zinc-finger